MEAQHPLDEAVEFIKYHLGMGFSEEQIRQHFASHGWPPHHIDDALHRAKQPASPSDRQHYSVSRAVLDALTIIRRYPQLYAVALLAGSVIFIIGIWLINTVSAALSHGLKSFGSLVAVLLISGLLTIIWEALVSSYILACTSQVLAERKGLTVASMLRLAVEQTPRAALASFVAGVITFGPFIILTIIGLVDLLSSSLLITVSVNRTLFSLIFPLLACVWLLVACLRLALVQQVALFEPERPIMSMMRRSYFLLRSGGQWFVFKGGFVLAVIYIVFRNLHHSSIFQTSAVDWAELFILLISAVVTQAALTMLYLNRVVIRGRS